MKKENYPQNIPEVFLNSANRFPSNYVLKYKEGHHLENVSYGELKDYVEKAVAWLSERGFKKGDRAVILSENRPEWIIADLAVLFLGGIIVPVHEALSSHQIVDIIYEIEPKFVFVSGNEIFEKIKILKNKTLPAIVSFEDLREKTFYFKKILENQVQVAELDTLPAKIQPEDLASIIYTSGTTGHFKGVKLTHRNFVSNLVNVKKAIPAYPSDVFFSILPLSHVFERTAGYYIPIFAGACISYTCDLDNFAQEIKKVKPTIILAVPRLFEKVYEKVLAKASVNFIQKGIFQLSLHVKKGSRLYDFFDNLVYARIKDEFGGNIRLFISGGAPLHSKVGKFFEQIGLLALEGYGLTECSPVVSVNRESDYQFGTVGKTINDTEVKISQEGEVLVRGLGVTPGYLEEKHNKHAFVDGWFKTGDLGLINSEGRLVISGRIKELAVLSTGKKVAPIPIEEMLETSQYIDQAMVIGEGRKHIAGLIVPNLEKLREKFGSSDKKLILRPEVRKWLADEVISLLEILAPYQRVHKFVIIPEPFTVENGQLTPTLKLRRHKILSVYRDQIEELYK